MTRLGLVGVMLVLAGSPAAAQTAPPAAPRAQSAAQTPVQPPAQPVEAAKPGYSYDPEGRRDPFQSLLGRGNDPQANANRPSGVAGLLISDVSVKGILRDRTGFVAMIQAPEGKTFLVKTGDKLFDGKVKAISQDQVIFSQDVNDPLSLVKQREIPKAVRPAEGRGASPGNSWN
jgi:type IV pilus assembly protein PilP